MRSITLSLTGPATQPPRSRSFWVLLGAIALAQLFAFWLLCSHQVRKAEARNTHFLVQQMALADCLQYIPGSTIASCSQGIDTMRAATQPAQDSAVAGAMPVSFSYR
jgi:hypothetical protein